LRRCLTHLPSLRSVDERVRLTTKLNWNKTVSKQFQNCFGIVFVSVSFQLCGHFYRSVFSYCYFVSSARDRISFVSRLMSNQGSFCQMSLAKGIRALGFDIRTGTVPQLGTSTRWKVVRSAGICIRDGQHWVKIEPLNMFMNISRGGVKHFRQRGRPPHWFSSGKCSPVYRVGRLVIAEYGDCACSWQQQRNSITDRHVASVPSDSMVQKVSPGRKYQSIIRKYANNAGFWVKFWA